MALTITPVHGCGNTYTATTDWGDFYDHAGHVEIEPTWMTHAEAVRLGILLNTTPVWAPDALMTVDLTPATPTPSPMTAMLNRTARLEREAAEALLPAWTSETGRPALRKGRVAHRTPAS